MIWSGVSVLSPKGFKAKNKFARLSWEPPSVPITWSTAGSFPITAMYFLSLVFIASKEIFWSATKDPIMTPVSCWGKKPLGTAIYK